MSSEDLWVKQKLKTKYHRWLEVQIINRMSKRFRSQNIVEEVSQNWEALKQERDLMEVTGRSQTSANLAQNIKTACDWLENVIWWYLNTSTIYLSINDKGHKQPLTCR